mmetsp:Transcript_18600/g.34464  ORF Transcript_18600/g.34464 Transcript_18600/m.34464 type:complete len:439 (+) Transcript_18600:183-1499(+)
MPDRARGDLSRPAAEEMARPTLEGSAALRLLSDQLLHYVFDFLGTGFVAGEEELGRWVAVVRRFPGLPLVVKASNKAANVYRVLSFRVATKLVVNNRPIDTKRGFTWLQGLGTDETIRELDLENAGLTNSDVTQLVQSLERNQTLDVIHLGKNFIFGDEYPVRCNLPWDKLRVKILTLRYGAIRGRGAHMFFKGLATSAKLTALHLTGNTTLGASELGNLGGLLERTKHLRVLLLDRCDVAETSLHGLLRGLAFNTSLQELSLAQNPAIRDQGAVMLADMLRENKTLQAVDLNMCEIGSMGATRLADAIVASSSPLQKLNLAYNRSIGGIGAAALGRMLKSPCQKLRELNVRECSSGNEGKREVIRALACNTTLTALDLGGERLDEPTEVVARLASALKQNQSLTKLSLEHFELSLEEKALLRKSAMGAPRLKHLLLD